MLLLLVFWTCQIILVLLVHISHQQVGAHLVLVVGQYCHKKFSVSKSEILKSILLMIFSSCGKE